MTITGTNHAGDAVTQGAKNDLVTGYNTAAGESPRTAVPADLGGQTLNPGTYNSASSLGLTGTVTLNGGGNPNAMFVFQAGSTLITASSSSVNLINGAQACNVFWQVGSSATLGTGSTFRGTILALTSITVTTATTIDGRVLARNGAVTLDNDTITTPDVCSLGGDHGDDTRRGNRQGQRHDTQSEGLDHQGGNHHRDRDGHRDTDGDGGKRHASYHRHQSPLADRRRVVGRLRLRVARSLQRPPPAHEHLIR